MPILRVEPEGIEYNLREGEDLLTLADLRKESPLKFGCRRGCCGVCAIRVEKGMESLTACSQEERALLEAKGLDEGHRLACQCAINGTVTVGCLDAEIFSS